MAGTINPLPMVDDQVFLKWEQVVDLSLSPLLDGYPLVKTPFEITREVILCLSMDLDHKLLLVNKLISSRF